MFGHPFDCTRSRLTDAQRAALATLPEYDDIEYRGR